MSLRIMLDHYVHIFLSGYYLSQQIPGVGDIFFYFKGGILCIFIFLKGGGILFCNRKLKILMFLDFFLNF